jgi:cell division protease FtsH
MNEDNSKWNQYLKWGSLSSVFALGAYYMFASSGPDPATVDYSTFLKHAHEGYYSSVTISGSHAASNVVYSKRPKSDISTPQQYALMPAHENTEIPSGESLVERIRNDTTVYAVPPADPSTSWKALAIRFFPIALLIGAGAYFLSNRKKNNRSLFDWQTGLGKSKTKRHYNVKTRFSDVEGIDEAKEELQEIVEYLKNPKKFTDLGAKCPKGALLVGPPGCGKTLLAKAIAGEANVPFFEISGSDFIEMYVGVGASRVRNMFEEAKKIAPAIIFVDEIDAVGRKRGQGQGGNNNEREQTLNQLLVEMDGFEGSSVILVAATNRPDILDPALTRPGRLDRQIEVGQADVNGRERILAKHTQKIKTGPDVDLRIIARGTPGFSGAQLANIVNEAALLAARRGATQAIMKDFEHAKDKVMMGVERKSAVISENDKLIAAYHEAGHALVTMDTPDAIPLYKTTIIPRGQKMGKTFQVPSGDMLSLNRSQINAILTVSMGGRVAEEMAFGRNQITSNAADDIKKARDLAHTAVTKWGMSETLGPVLCTEGSNAQLTIVDKEVHSMIMTAFRDASRILTARRHDLDILAQALLVQETMTAEDIKAALQITHELEDIQKSPEPA